MVEAKGECLQRWLECDNGRGVEMVEAKEKTRTLSLTPLQSWSLDPLETPEPPQTETVTKTVFTILVYYLSGLHLEIDPRGGEMSIYKKEGG